ncbi:MAG: metallopeptidase TldD-related protein [Gammaproteobacteria bacterium]|nr:metallopeptidase TldD-related protein [Gammaproteobacteria bacterium]
MNADSLKKIAEQTIQRAKQKGADAVEVDGHLGHGMSVNILNQHVDSLEYDRGKELSVTIYLGKKRGSATTNDFSPSSIERVVDAAYDFAHYAAEDPYSGLPARETLASNPPSVALYFPWKNLQLVDVIEKMRACEAYALSLNQKCIKSDGTGLNSHETYELIANSDGFMQGYASTSHSMHCALIAEHQGEMQRESEYTCSMDPSDLWSIEKIAEEAHRKTIARLGARQIPTQTLPILFTEQAAAGFWKYLIGAAMGGNIYRRSSFLMDALEQRILPEHISLMERPFLYKGVGSAPFDDDGVYTREKTFIDNGVLKTYFTGTYSGRQLGVPSTGNAGGVFNLLVNSPHAQPLADLISGMDKGLIVTETLGSGVNLVNGDYSKGMVGFYVERGQIQFPVEEVTIAGNLKEMYKHVMGLGIEQDHRYNIRTGAVLIDHMTVAGS